MYGDSWLDTSYAPVVEAFRKQRTAGPHDGVP